MDGDIEIIQAGGHILCYLIHSAYRPQATTFITDADARQQVGFIVYPKGGVIARHLHRSLERHLIGMSEVLVVRSGRCEIDVYDDEHKLVATRELNAGEVAIMVAGGHGFRVLENTVMLEIKQGPYLGAQDKELF